MENKRRLIDADALKKRFDERQADDIELYGGSHITECFPADDANEIVDKMPTVDAVEVVRCRECIFKQNPKQFGDLQCKILDVPMRKDDFCSYGERKEDVNA